MNRRRLPEPPPEELLSTTPISLSSMTTTSRMGLISTPSHHHRTVTSASQSSGLIGDQKSARNSTEGVRMRPNEGALGIKEKMMSVRGGVVVPRFVQQTKALVNEELFHRTEPRRRHIEEFSERLNLEKKLEAIHLAEKRTMEQLRRAFRPQQLSFTYTQDDFALLPHQHQQTRTQDRDGEHYLHQRSSFSEANHAEMPYAEKDFRDNMESDSRYRTLPYDSDSLKRFSRSTGLLLPEGETRLYPSHHLQNQMVSNPMGSTMLNRSLDELARCDGVYPTHSTALNLINHSALAKSVELDLDIVNKEQRIHDLEREIQLRKRQIEETIRYQEELRQFTQTMDIAAALSATSAAATAVAAPEEQLPQSHPSANNGGGSTLQRPTSSTTEHGGLTTPKPLPPPPSNPPQEDPYIPAVHHLPPATPLVTREPSYYEFPYEARYQPMYSHPTQQCYREYPPNYMVYPPPEDYSVPAVMYSQYPVPQARYEQPYNNRPSAFYEPSVPQQSLYHPYVAPPQSQISGVPQKHAEYMLVEEELSQGGYPQHSGYIPADSPMVYYPSASATRHIPVQRMPFYRHRLTSRGEPVTPLPVAPAPAASHSQSNWTNSSSYHVMSSVPITHPAHRTQAVKSMETAATNSSRSKQSGSQSRQRRESARSRSSSRHLQQQHSRDNSQHRRRGSSSDEVEFSPMNQQTEPEYKPRGTGGKLPTQERNNRSNSRGRTRHPDRQASFSDQALRRIMLMRDPRDKNIKGNGIGLAVVGGQLCEDGYLGAFVDYVFPGGVADQLGGQIKEGDEVLEWNGKVLSGKSYEEAQKILSTYSEEIEIVYHTSEGQPISRPTALAHPARDHSPSPGPSRQSRSRSKTRHPPRMAPGKSSAYESEGDEDSQQHRFQSRPGGGSPAAFLNGKTLLREPFGGDANKIMDEGVEQQFQTHSDSLDEGIRAPPQHFQHQGPSSHGTQFEESVQRPSGSSSSVTAAVTAMSLTQQHSSSHSASNILTAGAHSSSSGGPAPEVSVVDGGASGNSNHKEVPAPSNDMTMDNLTSFADANGPETEEVIQNMGEIELIITFDDYDQSLTVHIARARNLQPMDLNGLSDPFVKVRLHPDPTGDTDYNRQSRYMANSLAPEWEQTVVFLSVLKKTLSKRVLEVTVWDFDRLKTNDFMGQVIIPLSEKKYIDGKPHWYKLHELKDIVIPGQKHSALKKANSSSDKKNSKKVKLKIDAKQPKAHH